MATRKCDRAIGLAVAGSRRPGSCVSVCPSGGPWAKSWRTGESDHEHLVSAALAAVEREPVRKQWLARAGTAPREGKALKGTLQRDASGMEQGREASGCHGNGELRKGS